ncbi:hypothetical protein FGB62_93g029 [Gracilaria domingensis]|nr:hypothetical protein FGB62_93g029 [Gracilaria domingensis]
MGCFESKEQAPVRSYDDKKVRDTTKRTQLPSEQAQSAPEQLEVASQTIASDKEEAVPHVVSVPRAEVVVGERERAELKVKNMRDKLLTNISLSEEVLRQDAQLALKMRREGKQASARVLLRKRKLTQSRINKSETMLERVMDMIDTMDTAKDNASFVEALEQGTFAINEITKDTSAERVHNALADNNEAVEYVKHLGKIMEGETDTMTDEQLEDELDELAKEFDTAGKKESHDVAVEKIPDVPTEEPEEREAMELPSAQVDNNKVDDEDAVAA